MESKQVETTKAKPTEAAKVEKKSKKNLVMIIIGIICMLGGVGCVLFAFFRPVEEVEQLEYPQVPSAISEITIYSKLTGLPVASAEELTTPVYCIQTPNGTDGARPQAGLDQAGVIFEAIAEAGITRFAAIYQNPSAAAIGPIRSLRMYYLEWDTPFDCTIVHAGGADDALAALRSGGYKDLTENYTYMYRGNKSARRWNNLFTNATDLRQFTADRGYTTSSVNGFARLTPSESGRARADSLTGEKLNITKPASGNTSTLTPQVANISIRFGGVPAYNVNYAYDVTTNTYKRSYANGNAHEIYTCPTDNLGERNPEDICTLTQLNTSVVIAMIVSERRAADNYHESITTLGSGTAYIFQNGTAVKGTWQKATRADQIKFYDEAGKEVRLAPGQTFVSAVPTYGGVEY